MGSIVEQVVGDAADVSVIMPSGANPHAYEASARDAETMLNADILVSNGLDLEEALLSILETAEADGVTWFQAADHISALGAEDEHDLEGEEDHDHEGEDEHDAHETEDTEEDHDHDHGAVDPHIWTNPLFMVDVVQALEHELSEAGIDVTGNAAALVTELEALDAEVAEILAIVPEDQRKLVTGHMSLGYFADQYDFELIGTVIPGLTTSGAPTARELAQLIEAIEENQVKAVFAGVGTPQAVAQAVAGDGGAELAEISVSQLPEGGDYQGLVRALAVTIADALGE
jgi:zinc/manganese transport system substrate-binding protein